MTRTRQTPMAEYQIEETSYKSVKIKLVLLQKFKKFLKSKHVQLQRDNKDDKLYVEVANPIKVVRWSQKKETKPRWPLSRWLESSCCGSVSWSSSPSDQEAGHPAVELGRRGIRFRPMTRPRPRTRFKKRF